MSWDDICAQCGLCCHKREITDDAVSIDMNDSCRYLDKESNRCMAYGKRFTLPDVRCRKVTVLHAMFSDTLPPSCRYYAWAREHRIRFRKREKEMLLRY